MESLQRRVNDSLQMRLSVWLSLVILAVALIAGIFSFSAASDEANRFQDDILYQIATLFDLEHLPQPELGDKDRLSDSDSDEDVRVVVQILPLPTSPVGDLPPDRLALPSTLPDGIQTLNVAGENYRVLVKTLGPEKRLAVAQETAVRDEIVQDSAIHTVMPFLILVPILLLVVANLVRKIFRPVAAVSAEVDRRGDEELHAIGPQSLPAEIRPFVVAINRLLDRTARSMSIQRRFVADAAHELRTPLTALLLQAERLGSTELSETARIRLSTLRQGIERSRSLLDQLLALARAQTLYAPPSNPVSVQHVFRRVLEDLMPLAETKQLDIGVVSDVDAHVLASEIDLATVVKNIVDNAIRYTPQGGRIDLSVTETNDEILLEVEDNGPGVPAAEREGLFEPFYRAPGNQAPGSGLGLSIVRTVTERLGGIVLLADAMRSSTGLRVIVSFPVRSRPVPSRFK